MIMGIEIEGLKREDIVGVAFHNDKESRVVTIIPYVSNKYGIYSVEPMSFYETDESDIKGIKKLIEVDMSMVIGSVNTESMVLYHKKGAEPFMNLSRKDIKVGDKTYRLYISEVVREFGKTVVKWLGMNEDMDVMRISEAWKGE